MDTNNVEAAVVPVHWNYDKAGNHVATINGHECLIRRHLMGGDAKELPAGTRPELGGVAWTEWTAEIDGKLLDDLGAKTHSNPHAEALEKLAAPV